jgi:hypothetical protein
MSIQFSKITHDQWFKVLKAFIFAALSLVFSSIPALLAHNATYLSLTVPINVVLVTLKQLVTQGETTALNQLPSNEQKQVMSGVNELSTGITDTEGNLVTNPDAAR